MSYDAIRPRPRPSSRSFPGIGSTHANAMVPTSVHAKVINADADADADLIMTVMLM